MKMLKTIIICLVSIMIQSCNSQKKDKVNEQQEKILNNQVQVPFDLINIKLEENIKDVLNTIDMCFKDNEETDAFTLFTNQKFESTKSKVLAFDKIALSGKNDNQNNNVIFHYSEEDSIIKMYQVNIFSKQETESLEEKLNSKFGKTIFQNQKSGNVSDIVDGEMKQTNIKFDEKVAIWSNKNLIYYFFTQIRYNKSIEYKSNLFVLKKQKEWVDFIGGLGYQDINQSLK